MVSAGITMVLGIAKIGAHYKTVKCLNIATFVILKAGRPLDSRIVVSTNWTQIFFANWSFSEHRMNQFLIR